MKDPFALLGLERRPWLDASEIRRAFQLRGREAHPDRPGGDAGAFAELNAAQAALADSAERLKLLLGDEAIPSTPPDMDFAFRLAGALRDADALAQKAAAAANPISRALLAREVAAARDVIAGLLAHLSEFEARAESRLRQADADWPATEGLGALAAEFVYLRRWRQQLRERLLALS